MIKVFVNAETIKYYPKNNVIIEPGSISIVGIYGNVITKHDVYVINLRDGLARKDVRSLVLELESTDTIPTFYCNISKETIASQADELSKLNEDDIAIVLEERTPDIKLDIDFSKDEPLDESLKVTPNQIGCLTGDDAVSSIVENFSDIVWKDYVNDLGYRSKEKLSNATSYEEAINYLASELATMKAMVNEFLDSLKEKL